MTKPKQIEHISISTWADVVHALRLFSLPYARSGCVIGGSAMIERAKDGTSYLTLKVDLKTQNLSLYKPFFDPTPGAKP